MQRNTGETFIFSPQIQLEKVIKIINDFSINFEGGSNEPKGLPVGSNNSIEEEKYRMMITSQSGAEELCGMLLLKKSKIGQH
jgi:hypothetical protein